MSEEKGKPRARGFSWSALDSAFPFRRSPPAPVAPSSEPPPVDEAYDQAEPPPDLTGVFLTRDHGGPRPAPRPIIDPALAVDPSAELDAEDGPDTEEIPADASAPAEAGTAWPSKDDRLAAVRRLIPRQQLEDPLPPPRPQESLPEPVPEPRRPQTRRTAAYTVQDERPARRFRPLEPPDLHKAGLPDGLIEALVVKHLYNAPGASGRALAYDIGLRNTIVVRILEDLKMRRLAIHRSAAAMGDFYYELTEEGRALARELMKDSRYAGPAPVPLEQYVTSVKAQAISTEKPKMADLRGAFADLEVPEVLLEHIGPAVTHGKGLFMYGPPGNGKTSLAERITRAYGTTVYLPHAIYAGGHIIQVFDPAVHFPVEESDLDAAGANKLDRRWIRCRRPTVVVGGELTLDALDIAFDEIEGICEAPIQIKANTGTLVIDDFGRQRCQPDELLNRWIVPLEKKVDYIALPGGRKEAFPFECLLVFSTNMEPKDLVDEAFLRRIPYKLQIGDPDEPTFRRLCETQAEALGLQLNPGVIEYAMESVFRSVGRPMRYCHPRDLMLQVANLRAFREEPMVVDEPAIDEAAFLYFSLL